MLNLFFNLCETFLNGPKFQLIRTFLFYFYKYFKQLLFKPVWLVYTILLIYDFFTLWFFSVSALGTAPGRWEGEVGGGGVGRCLGFKIVPKFWKEKFLYLCPPSPSSKSQSLQKKNQTSFVMGWKYLKYSGDGSTFLLY